MPLSVEVGLRQGQTVLDGNPAASTVGAQQHRFRSLRPEALPASVLPRPMSFVAKRLDGSGCHLVRR